MYRKEHITNGNYYHVLNRSIAGFRIFNTSHEYSRMVRSIFYYEKLDPPTKFSRFMEYSKERRNSTMKEGECSVEVLCYCLMPTHIHLVLKQNVDGGISKFMQKVSNSYSKYFNIKHKRKGPLWESNFKIVTVHSDKQLLHLTRYIHLNPVSAGITDNPEKWNYSSYRDYIKKRTGLCTLSKILDISAKSYERFTIERIDYQKQLSIIKKEMLENYTG